MHGSGTCLQDTSVALGKPVFATPGAQTHVHCMEYYQTSVNPQKGKNQPTALWLAVRILTPESGFVLKYHLKSVYSWQCPASTR